MVIGDRSPVGDPVKDGQQWVNSSVDQSKSINDRSTSEMRREGFGKIGDEM